MSYAKPNNRSINVLYRYLNLIFKKYYIESMDFHEMVCMFADDDFYKAHYVAKRYICLKGNN